MSFQAPHFLAGRNNDLSHRLAESVFKSLNGRGIANGK
jgi:hypothetical protein